MAPILLLLLAFALYFMPALIANHRKHMNQNSIFLVNLFFGLTGIGWIVSLIWSASANTQANKKQNVVVLDRETGQVIQTAIAGMDDPKKSFLPTTTGSRVALFVMVSFLVIIWGGVMVSLGQ